MFSKVDGKEVGHAAVSFPKIDVSTPGVRPVPGCLIIPDSVSAVAFSGIIGPAELRVNCLVFTPTPGYTAKPEPAKPQGINPRILLLNLVVHAPTQPEIQIPDEIPASYELTPYSGNYTDVTILNGNQSVTVPVIAIFSASEASHKYAFSATRPAPDPASSGPASLARLVTREQSIATFRASSRRRRCVDPA